MGRIIFKQMELDGFMSFLNPSVWNWDNDGLNNIIAPNETGKSTLVYALEFCLFGVNARGGNIDKIPTYEWLRNDSTWNGTRVIQTIQKDNDTYDIARHIKYKSETFGLVGGDKLIIRKNGNIIDDYLHKKDMQEFIETELLECKFNVFTSAIIFNQRKTSLLQESGSVIREILDNIFETSFLDQAKEKASTIEKDLLKRQTNNNLIYDKRGLELKYLKQSYDSEFTLCNNTISDHNNSIISLELDIITHKQKLLDKKEKFDSIKLEEINDFSKEINEYKDKLRLLDKQKSDLENNMFMLNSEISILEQTINNNNNKVSSYENDLIEFRNNKFLKLQDLKDKLTLFQTNSEKVIQEKIGKIDKTCPTCGQNFTEDYYNNIINSIIKIEEDSLQDKITLIKEQMAKIEMETLSAIDVNKINEESKSCKNKIDSYDITLIDKDKLLKDVKKEITSVTIELEKLISSQDEIRRKYEIENNKFSKIKDELSKQISALTSAIAVAENQVVLLKNDIIKCENKLKSLLSKADEIKELSLSFTELDNERKDIEKELSSISWWNKKGFSNKGIKAYIYNNMLKELNKNIYKYSSKFDSVIRFSIDLEKQSTPFMFEIIKGGNKVLYNELSGGAQKRCDLAVAFGMYDLTNNTSNDFNILILDEFTENLDKKNVELCYEMLRNKMIKGRSIYSITHTETDLLQIKKQYLSNINGITKIN